MGIIPLAKVAAAASLRNGCVEYQTSNEIADTQHRAVRDLGANDCRRSERDVLATDVIFRFAA